MALLIDSGSSLKSTHSSTTANCTSTLGSYHTAESYIHFEPPRTIKVKMSIQKAAKSSYRAIVNKISKYKHTKIENKLRQELHAKQAEFISLVLQRLPFLYIESPEMENYQWIRLAYDLKLQNKLIPDLIRYQVGPTFYISFGSIATQLKREFYLLLLNNDRTVTPPKLDPSAQYIDKAGVCNSACSFECPKIKIRDNSVDDLFEFFTVEELRNIILNGDRLNANYYNKAIANDEDSTKDWYHKWGWVYETEPTCYRALDMEVGNYLLELAVLEYLQKLNVSTAELPNTMGVGIITISDLIKEKESLIKQHYLPNAKDKKEAVADQLKKCKKNSQKYYDLLNY